MRNEWQHAFKVSHTLSALSTEYKRGLYTLILISPLLCLYQSEQPTHENVQTLLACVEQC